MFEQFSKGCLGHPQASLACFVQHNEDGLVFCKEQIGHIRNQHMQRADLQNNKVACPNETCEES